MNVLLRCIQGFFLKKIFACKTNHQGRPHSFVTKPSKYAKLCDFSDTPHITFANEAAKLLKGFYLHINRILKTNGIKLGENAFEQLFYFQLVFV